MRYIDMNRLAENRDVCSAVSKEPNDRSMEKDLNKLD